MWTVCNADGEVGFRYVRVRYWGGLRWWLKLLLDASPTTTKCAVGKVRAGWVEAEEFVEYDL